MRLPALLAIAAGSLALYFDAAEAARVRLPAADNPYCAIATYRAREIPEQAMSVSDSSGRPVIVISDGTLTSDPSYARFLLAHECCHHSLGHVQRYRERRGAVGPQPFFFIAPELKRLELEADCCAVGLLRDRSELDGIDAARLAMMRFGAAPTGAYYPTGIERANNIMSCARRD